jgi:hypothetical protein
MKQKLVIGSVLIAVIIILTSIASVVGKTVEENNYCMVDSPLFTARSQPQNTIMSTRYLGYGETNDWIQINSARYYDLVTQALQILNSKPAIRKNMIEYIESNPKIISLMQKNDLSIRQIEQDIQTHLQNPEDLQMYMVEYLNNNHAITPPEPLGLSTSNPIGCFIVVIAMLPLFLLLTILIATITIVTCLNVGGCFEAIWTQIGESFIQGLSPN